MPSLANQVKTGGGGGGSNGPSGRPGIPLANCFNRLVRTAFYCPCVFVAVLGEEAGGLGTTAAQGCEDQRANCLLEDILRIKINC